MVLMGFPWVSSILGDPGVWVSELVSIPWMKLSHLS